ncbi:MAG: Formyl transferase domain protein, partial [candidate division CPR1 bacterium GW2011_GWA2_42_17]
YIEQLWKTAPFSFVLTSNNIDPFHFALLSFARNHSIPYALLIHDAQGSTFCDFFYKPDDTLLVWGNFQKRLISKEFPTLRCIVTGHPDFDNSMAQTKENQPIFDLKSKKIIRVLVLSTYNPYVQFPNQEVLFDVFRELNKIKKYRIAVTLKSHPSEYHAKLVDLVQKSIDYPLQLSFESADKLIEANDIIVTQSTSAGFRAVLLSKPTVYLNLHDYKDYEPYAEEGAALGVYSLSQLNPSIEALIKQPDICRKDQTIFSAVDILKFLTKQNIKIVGLIIHPAKFSKKGEELVRLSRLPKNKIFYGDRLNTNETVTAIRNLKPDLFLSINFRYLLKDQIISVPSHGCINLHFGYLPYNRGVFADAWSIIDDTPAGITYHLIDPGIDTGKIVVQQQVEKSLTDTGKSLYQKLTLTAYDLFVKTWPKIQNWSFKPITQSSGGAYHRRSGISLIDKIDLNKKYLAKDLINILRARTFPPYNGAYFLTPQGKKIYLRLQLYIEK